jgi:hypothetical protein
LGGVRLKVKVSKSTLNVDFKKAVKVTLEKPVEEPIKIQTSGIKKAKVDLQLVCVKGTLRMFLTARVAADCCSAILVTKGGKQTFAALCTKVCCAGQSGRSVL